MLSSLFPKILARTVLRSPAVPLLYWLLFPGLVLLAIACTSTGPQPLSQPKAAVSGGDTCAVKIVTHKDGKTTWFEVENHELCEVTMTFDLGLVNLKPSVGLPYTATFPAGKTTMAFSVAPVDETAKWSYTYTNHFKLGSNCVRHDDDCTYELPYGPGEKFEVTQGYDGKFSHKGSNKYAIDWQMPQGSLVRATRGGLVVRTKDDSDRGGGSMDYDHFNNYVLIRHEDGTLGHYCHLQKGGVLVKPGQTVVAGEPIAHSGSTGFSTGPHLHFSVFMAKSGTERVSIPVKFRTSRETAITLVSGQTYQAANVSVATAKAPTPVPATATAATGGVGAQ